MTQGCKFTAASTAAAGIEASPIAAAEAVAASWLVLLEGKGYGHSAGDTSVLTLADCHLSVCFFQIELPAGVYSCQPGKSLYRAAKSQIYVLAHPYIYL
eukprot:6211960-Pleurochrysis_carterae.AAC.2